MFPTRSRAKEREKKDWERKKKILKGQKCHDVSGAVRSTLHIWTRSSSQPLRVLCTSKRHQKTQTILLSFSLVLMFFLQIRLCLLCLVILLYSTDPRGDLVLPQGTAAWERRASGRARRPPVLIPCLPCRRFHLYPDSPPTPRLAISPSPGHACPSLHMARASTRLLGPETQESPLTLRLPSPTHIQSISTCCHLCLLNLCQTHRLSSPMPSSS